MAERRRTLLVPLLIITLACILMVEGFYWGLERFILKPETKAIAVVEKQESGVVSPEPQNGASRRPDPGIITRRNLFGPPPDETSKQGEAVAAPPQELEATKLDVVLMGTIGGGDENSRAIILNKKDRKQEIYQVGDGVQGAIIKAIQRGKVIITFNGRDEMLDMSEASSYGAKTVRPTSASPTAIPRRVVPAPITGESVSAPKEAVKTRVVRPTRRIVRPRTITSPDDGGDTNQIPVELPEDVPEK